MEMIPVDHDPFAHGVKPLQIDPLIGAESKLGLTTFGAAPMRQPKLERVEHDPFTKESASPALTKLERVEHDPFKEAPAPDLAKLAQFERLEKKGAPENITRVITGLYRDESGQVRTMGSKEEPKSKIAAEQQMPRIETKPALQAETKVPEMKYPPKIIAHVSAQPEFVRQIEGFHQKLPEFPQRVLRDGGSGVYIGEKLTDHSPWLAGQTPRGWPAGTSWENAEGLARNGDVHIARTCLDRFSREWVPTHRAEGVYNHETGHAFDFHNDWLSSRDRFLKEYKRDRDKIVFDDEHAQDLAYYLQREDAGPKEAFAEVFAQIIGPGSQGERVLQHFPRVEAYMRDLLSRGIK